MELIALPERPSNWDALISPFASKTLFHESAWLDFIVARDPRRGIAYYRIVDEGQPVGYFCAVINCRARFRFCESPAPGRGIHLAPIVNHTVNPACLVAAVVDMCRREGIASLDLTLAGLSPAMMQAFGFASTMNTAQMCSLEGGSTAAWERFTKTRRASLRKAERDGLVAEATDDPAIADCFYQWYEQALTRKDIAPTYGVEQVRSMLTYLLPADRLFAVRVKRYGRVIGAGFYVHDDRTMYYWDGASDPSELKHYPNDLLHWTAIQLAAARGIGTFQMACGPAPQPMNRFALNFGCREELFPHYHRSLVPLLKPVRDAHRWLSTIRLGRAQRKLAAVPVPVALTAVVDALCQ